VSIFIKKGFEYSHSGFLIRGLEQQKPKRKKGKKKILVHGLAISNEFYAVYGWVKVHVRSFTFVRASHSCTFRDDIKRLSFKERYDAISQLTLCPMWNAIASIFRH